MALSSLLLQWDRDLPSYLQRGPLLAQEEVALCTQAVDLLEKARARCSALAEDAQREFEHQKKRGYDDGIKQGQAAAALHHIKTVLATLDYYDQSQQQLVTIVMNCLRRLIIDLPAEERFYQLIGKALEELKQQPRIVLQIHPRDRQAVEAALPKLQALMPIGSKIEVRTREELVPNSCILESPLGLVDASLESQLMILERSLLEASGQ